VILYRVPVLVRCLCFEIITPASANEGVSRVAHSGLEPGLAALGEISGRRCAFPPKEIPYDRRPQLSPLVLVAVVVLESHLE
jgi:hypothetical protein